MTQVGKLISVLGTIKKEFMFLNLFIIYLVLVYHNMLIVYRNNNNNLQYFVEGESASSL